MSLISGLPPLSRDRPILQSSWQGTGGNDSPRPATLARRHQSIAMTAVQNKLCGYRQTISRHGGGVAVQVMLTGPMALPPDSAWLEMAIDDNSAHIGLSWGTVRRLTGVPLESADPVDAAVLVESALSAWLDAVAEQTGLTIRLRRFAPPHPAVKSLRLGLRCEVLSGPAAASVHLELPLSLSERAGNAIASILSRRQAVRPETLPLYLRLGAEIETTGLSRAELRGLRPGDALVLPDFPRAARLIVEDQFIAPVRPADDGPLPLRWRLTGRFQPLPPSPLSQTGAMMPMSEPESQSAKEDQENTSSGPSGHTPRGQSEIPGGLDALEVRVSFRLGERLVSLAELRRAGPGTILTLDRPDGAMVDIVANGQLIGTGEVISVGGQRAVEIRNLFGSE